EAEGSRVDTNCAVLGLLGLPHSPLLKFDKLWRLVLEGEALLCGLQMRIAGPPPPDVTLRVRGLRLHLGVILAAALPRQADLDAAGPLEGCDHGAAPFFLDRAVDHQLALRSDRGGHKTGAEPGQEGDEHPNA